MLKKNKGCTFYPDFTLPVLLVRCIAGIDIVVYPLKLLGDMSPPVSPPMPQPSMVPEIHFLVTFNNVISDLNIKP